MTELMESAPATLVPSQAGKGTNKVANLREKVGQPTRKPSAGTKIRSPRIQTYISQKIKADSRFATTTTPVNASYLVRPPDHMFAKFAGPLDTRSQHALAN